MKKITINLIDFRKFQNPIYIDVDFRVDSIQNSTKFECGQNISKGDVDRLCTKPTWTVNIKAPKDKDF